MVFANKDSYYLQRKEKSVYSRLLSSSGGKRRMMGGQEKKLKNGNR